MTSSQLWIDDDQDHEPGPFGVVPVTGRGSLPFALVHDESLVATASWALAEAGVELLDFTVTWSRVRAARRAVVFHDPLCPLTPVPFLRAAVQAAEHAVVVGFRPVSDTVKRVAGDVVGTTVDRESLVSITSPIVLPADVVGALDDWPDTDDFAVLVAALRARAEVVLLEAPALGGRVGDESALRLLEAMGDELRTSG